MKTLAVDINDWQELKDNEEKINKTPLRDIKFYDKGFTEVKVSEKDYLKHEEIGYDNLNFIMRLTWLIRGSK